MRPRQVEEESDAGAPNLAIGPDYEDDTTKEVVMLECPI
jgi:hypothetical protein